MMKSYTLEQIPKWCHMPHSAHFDNLGGCWGISYGQVAESGESYCLTCEYHENNAPKVEQCQTQDI